MSAYQTNIQEQIEHTNKLLPTSELKYYLLLLLNSLKAQQESQFTMEMLHHVKDFISKLMKVMNLVLPLDEVDEPSGLDEEKIKELFEEVTKSYQQLVASSKTKRLPAKIGYALLNVGGAILMLFTSIIGGLIGGFAGFGRSIYNANNPFTGTYVGVVTGFMLGAAIGFRLPKKIFKNELTRQLAFCLDGIKAAMNTIELSYQEHWQTLLQETEIELCQQYFGNDQDAFQDYLESEVTYEICTIPAQFISETLKGYLGHHAFIKLPVNTIKNTTPIVIEFSTGKTDLARPMHNKPEQRTVSGDKIVEMIAFHKLLQETHTCNRHYILTKMKSGDVDCLSYVDKLLTATSQDATFQRRFNGSEHRVGKWVGFFIEKLSPFKKDILREEPMSENNSGLGAK